MVRVAGNVLGAECLGSLAYAAEHMADSLRIVVVLGHSGCGAVTAGVDAFLDTAAYQTGVFGAPLRAIVDRVLLSVWQASQALEPRAGASVRESAGYRAALIEISVAVNAGLTAMTLREELVERVAGELGAVFGIYDLATHHVGVPGTGAVGEVALRAPPSDAAGLEALAASVAGNPQVQALLRD